MSPISHDLALLGLRLALAVVFVFHGGETLFGWFGGSGLTAESRYFATLGLEPARPLALLAGLGQLGGGLLMALGALPRLAALDLIVVMIVAIAADTGAKGFAVYRGGYEYNVVLIAVAVAVLLLGPGRWRATWNFGAKPVRSTQAAVGPLRPGPGVIGAKLGERSKGGPTPPSRLRVRGR